MEKHRMVGVSTPPLYKRFNIKGKIVCDFAMVQRGASVIPYLLYL